MLYVLHTGWSGAVCVCSPLDELIDSLGAPDCVAEMTGRRWRIVRPSPSDLPTVQLRDASLDSALGSSGGSLDTLNVREVRWTACFVCK